MKLWLRTITRYRLYTFINLSGLALGICAVVAIFLFVTDEISYDRFHANIDHLYRINKTNHSKSEPRCPTTSAAVGEAIRNDLADASAARVYSRQGSVELVNSRAA